MIHLVDLTVFLCGYLLAFLLEFLNIFTILYVVRSYNSVFNSDLTDVTE